MNRTLGVTISELVTPTSNDIVCLFAVMWHMKDAFKQEGLSLHLLVCCSIQQCDVGQVAVGSAEAAHVKYELWAAFSHTCIIWLLTEF